jgi:hypothetical protein
MYELRNLLAKVYCVVGGIKKKSIFELGCWIVRLRKVVTHLLSLHNYENKEILSDY